MLTGNLSRPLQIFFAKNYTEAELYFRTYIEDKANKLNFNLHKIGEISDKLEFTKNRIFIANGYEVETEKRKKETIKELREKIDKAVKEESTIKQINLLFEGKEIE